MYVRDTTHSSERRRLRDPSASRRHRAHGSTGAGAAGGRTGRQPPRSGHPARLGSDAAFGPARLSPARRGARLGWAQRPARRLRGARGRPRRAARARASGPVPRCGRGAAEPCRAREHPQSNAILPPSRHRPYCWAHRCANLSRLPPLRHCQFSRYFQKLGFSVLLRAELGDGGAMHVITLNPNGHKGWWRLGNQQQPAAAKHHHLCKAVARFLT